MPDVYQVILQNFLELIPSGIPVSNYPSRFVSDPLSVSFLFFPLLTAQSFNVIAIIKFSNRFIQNLFDVEKGTCMNSCEMY